MTNTEKIARFREVYNLGCDSLREAFRLWNELDDAGISLRTILGAAEYDKTDSFAREHLSGTLDDGEEWRRG